MPFLTDLDRRAEVKGSRDPLGLVPLWSHFGREVVGNLTTVSSSVRGFTTLLLGLYYAEQLQEATRDERPSAVDVFLKFEQLAGYARVVHGDDNVRGERRIKARVKSNRIRISPAADDQILSNQKVYGIWGLFSMPGRASELLLHGEQRLTPAARDFVERHYVPHLGKRVVDLLRRDAFYFEPRDRDADLAQALAKVHGPVSEEEAKFYRHHLAWGGDPDTTAGKQRLLSDDLATQGDIEKFGFPEFRAVRKRIAKRGDGEALLVSLDRIDAVERLMNPARIAFGFLLTRNDRAITEVADEISRAWRRPPSLPLDLLESMEADLAAASWPEAAKRWLELGRLASAGEYLPFLETLIEANTDVMRKRNGSAAWLALEGGQLRVRMLEETEALLPVSEVENLWRSTFFINSLWAVTREVTNGH